MPLEEGFEDVQGTGGTAGKRDNDKNSFTSSSLQYQEVNYSQQNTNQRLLNTLETQDHIIAQALYRKDVKFKLGSKGSGTGQAGDAAETELSVRFVGDGYDKGLSTARAKHFVLKKMVNKN